MVQHDQVAHTADGQPHPALWGITGERAQQARAQHDKVGGNGGNQVGAGQTGHEGKVDQDERGGNSPVEVTQPQDLAVNILGGVGDVFVVVGDVGMIISDTLAGGKSKIGDEGEGGDEGCSGMEDTASLVVGQEERPVNTRGTGISNLAGKVNNPSRRATGGLLGKS